MWIAAVIASTAPAQTPSTPFTLPPTSLESAERPKPARKLRIQPPNPVSESEVLIFAEKQMKDGEWYRLRGHSVVQTDTSIVKADEIDYNEDTGDVDARGNVYLQAFEDGEEMWCDRAIYNVNDVTGKFYNVRGQAPTHIEARPRVLTTSNPFYFQGDWGERLQEKFILHDGFVTNCKMPKPWWIMRSPTFDIIQGDRAISHHTVFRLRGVPIFYLPYYYKSLKKLPRQSGFFMPNIGNSSLRGKFFGLGYYWAINRSYDASYRTQLFTQNAYAHTMDFRGKPRAGTDFDALFYGVQDNGVKTSTTNPATGQVTTKYLHPIAPGYSLNVQGKSELGDGFYARFQVDYLSSLLFRQTFTESYTEAISTEQHSIGFVAKDWSSFGFDVAASRLQSYQSTRDNDFIIIRKLPEVDFSSRMRQLFGNMPIWVSWQTSSVLIGRTEPDFQTRNLLERLDASPTVSTVLRWKDFALVPSFSISETHYGESRNAFDIVGQNINRSAREANVDLELPSLARVYRAPKWLGDQLKHVIEAGATYHYVTGVDNFNNIVRFDVLDLLSNTNQAEFWVTNRLYAKSKDHVNEVMSWDVRQQRYFDPTFGGAITNWCGQAFCRDMVLSGIELTGYAFIDRPRNYSPLISTLRLMPKPGYAIEWRADYDPLRHNLVASTFNGDVRYKKYGLSIGHTSLKDVPPPISDPGLTTLIPNTNQLRGQFTIGDDNRRGWNAGFSAIYDYTLRQFQFATTEVTYNTDCCGFSVQYRRLGGTSLTNQNIFRFSFSVANLGAFGTLKKQDRLF